jgi:glycosyltransferase involved in cell wall biosynthesis
MHPQLTIITVNLNNFHGLKRTIQSVRDQKLKNYEFIVVDGVSKDGSVECIEENRDIIHTAIVEKDKGIYDAMNKGIGLAKGKYVIFLNSGDFFYNDDVLQEVFENQRDEDIIYGHVLSAGNVRRVPEKVTASFILRRSLNHQGSFIKKTLFDDLGLYETRFRYDADWAFFIRAILGKKCSTYYVDRVIAVFEGGGMSSKRDFSNYKEQTEVIQYAYPEMHDFYKDYMDLVLIKKEWMNIQNSRLHKVAFFLQKLLAKFK